jgi:hypothetical protein
VSYAVSRREFLNQLALYLPAVPLAWSVACTRAPSPPEWRPLALRASAWFHRQDLGAVRLIGAHFLTRVGRDYDGLKVELGPTLELLKKGGDRGTSTEIEAAIAGDFQRLAVRDVEGWTLAATEAHLAALVELFGISA